MIRLAMLSEYPEDEQSLDGGVQAVTKYLVDELLATGQLEIHVLSFSYVIDKIETRQRSGYTHHLIPASPRGAFSVYKRDQNTMDDCLARLRPDIVHSQGAGHYGIVAARSAYPTIITIHGIMSEEAKHAAGLRLKFRRWFINQLSNRYCIRGTKSTIIISPYVADYYGDQLVGPRFHIPNPVTPAFFAVKRAESRGRILFAGRLLPLKGLRDLLTATAAVGKSQDIELVLAGSLDNHRYVSGLRSQAAKLGIQEIVHFRGILNEAELLDEFSKAAVLVLPSYQETAPMVIQEANAAGVPVIATRVGGIPFQIDDGETGLIFEPGDIQGLTDHLTSMLQDEQLRNSIATAAKEHAEGHYRASKVAARTIEAYKKFIASPLL